MERCSISSVISEMQIITTIDITHTYQDSWNFKMTKLNSCKYAEKPDQSYLSGWNVKWNGHSGK